MRSSVLVVLSALVHSARLSDRAIGSARGQSNDAHGRPRHALDSVSVSSIHDNFGAVAHQHQRHALDSASVGSIRDNFGGRTRLSERVDTKTANADRRRGAYTQRVYPTVTEESTPRMARSASLPEPFDDYVLVDDTCQEDSGRPTRASTGIFSGARRATMRVLGDPRKAVPRSVRRAAGGTWGSLTAAVGSAFGREERKVPHTVYLDTPSDSVDDPLPITLYADSAKHETVHGRLSENQSDGPQHRDSNLSDAFTPITSSNVHSAQTIAHPGDAFTPITSSNVHSAQTIDYPGDAFTPITSTNVHSAQTIHYPGDAFTPIMSTNVHSAQKIDYPGDAFTPTSPARALCAQTMTHPSDTATAITSSEQTKRHPSDEENGETANGWTCLKASPKRKNSLSAVALEAMAHLSRTGEAALLFARVHAHMNVPVPTNATFYANVDRVAEESARDVLAFRREASSRGIDVFTDASGAVTAMRDVFIDHIRKKITPCRF